MTASRTISLAARRSVVFAALLSATYFGAPSSASAQSAAHPFGAGISLGEPSGFTLKHWFDESNALQAGIGWAGPYDWDDYPAMMVTADWTYRFLNARTLAKAFGLGVYVGVGAGIGWLDSGCPANYRYCRGGSSIFAMIRVPLGLALHLLDGRLELYGEIAPSLRVAPSPYPLGMGALGLRFYF